MIACSHERQEPASAATRSSVGRLAPLSSSAWHEHDAAVQRFLADRFLFGRLDVSAISPSPTDARWIDELPPGTAQAAARRLLAEATTTSATAAVAREALTLLYSMANER